METTPTFGSHVRALRQAKGLTQMKVAAAVDARLAADGRRGFDMTYLSKIEKGRMPPPSTLAIVHLAAVLETPSDELLALAEKAPLDLGELLSTNPAARRFYRRAVDLDLQEEEWATLARALEEREQIVRALAGPLAAGARVYASDGNAYFNRPGPRIVESLEILAACVHPDEFRDLSRAHLGHYVHFSVVSRPS